MGDARDWGAEIDRWTERFRSVEDPPEPFATALRAGWTDEAREALAREAEDYSRRHRSWLDQIGGAGEDLVRLDCREGSCGLCAKYCGKAFSLNGDTPGLPDPPPLPICPACRHTLNLLTPFFMSSLGIDVEDLIDEAQPFVD